MVVKYWICVLSHENITITHSSSSTPQLIRETWGIMTTHLFFSIARLSGTDHIEEYTIHCSIGWHMTVLSPKLRALAPCVVLIVVGPFWLTLVFNIKEDEVYTHTRWHLTHHTRHFHKDRHSRSAIIGTWYWFTVVTLIGVMIGPLAAIPMRRKQHALGCLWIQRCYNVSTGYHSAVP